MVGADVAVDDTLHSIDFGMDAEEVATLRRPHGVTLAGQGRSSSVGLQSRELDKNSTQALRVACGTGLASADYRKRTENMVCSSGAITTTILRVPKTKPSAGHPTWITAALYLNGDHPDYGGQFGRLSTIVGGREERSS